MGQVLIYLSIMEERRLKRYTAGLYSALGSPFGSNICRDCKRRYSSSIGHV